jgi:hypothetical protein
MPKAEHKAARDIIQHAKAYEDVLELVGGEAGMARGGEELDAIRTVLAERESLRAKEEPTTEFEAVTAGSELAKPEEVDSATIKQVTASLEAPPDAHEADPVTPAPRPNPEEPTSKAPRLPNNPLRTILPASVLDQNAVTPTPGGGIELSSSAS